MGCTLGAQKVAKAEAKKEGKPTKIKEKNGKSDSKQDLVNETSSKNGQECNSEKQGEENLDNTSKEDGAKNVATVDQGLDQKGDNVNNSNPDCVVSPPGSPQASADEPGVASNNSQIEAVTTKYEGDAEGQKGDTEKKKEDPSEQIGSNEETKPPSCPEKDEDVKTANCDGEGKQEPATTEAEGIPVAVLKSEYSIESQKNQSDIPDEVPLQSTQQDSGDNDAKTIEVCQENMTEESEKNIVSTQSAEDNCTTEIAEESKTQGEEVSRVDFSENKVEEVPFQTPGECEANETESLQVKSGEMENDVAETLVNVVKEQKEPQVESPQENTLQETEESTVEDTQEKTETQTEEMEKSTVEFQENKLETTEQSPEETLEKNKEDETCVNSGEIPEGNKEIDGTDLNTIETQENKVQEIEEHKVETQEENKIEESEESVSETLSGNSSEKANETITETVQDSNREKADESEIEISPEVKEESTMEKADETKTESSQEVKEESTVEKADENETESSPDAKENDDVIGTPGVSEEKEFSEAQAESASNEQIIDKAVNEVEDLQSSPEIMEETDTDINTSTMEEPSAVVEDVKAQSQEEDIKTEKEDLTIPAAQEETSQENIIEESPTESKQNDSEVEGSPTDAAESAGDCSDYPPQPPPSAADDPKSESEAPVKVESETKSEESITVIPSEQNKVEVDNVENMTSSPNDQTVEQQEESVQDSARTTDEPNINTTEGEPKESSEMDVVESSVDSVLSPAPDRVEQDATDPQVEENKYSSEEIGSSVDALPPPPQEKEATVDIPPNTSTEETTAENTETSIDAGSGVDNLPPPPPQIDDTVQTQLVEDGDETTEQTALPPPPPEDFVESELQDEIEPAVAPGEVVCNEQSKEENDSQAVVMESSVDALPASQEENVPSAIEEEPQTQNGGSSVDPGTQVESQPQNEQISQNSKDTINNNVETESAASQVEDLTDNTAVEEESKQPEEMIQVPDVPETNPGETKVDSVPEGSTKCTEACKKEIKEEEVDETVVNGKGLQEDDIPECHSIESDDAECDDVEEDEITDVTDESTLPQPIPSRCEESTVTDNEQVLISDTSNESMVEKQLENGDNAQKEIASSSPSKVEVAE